MDNNSAYADYTKALRAGMREHRHCAASGVASYVQVLEDGIKKERVIETGIKNAAYIEVINGLSEGEEVIIK